MTAGRRGDRAPYRRPALRWLQPRPDFPRLLETAESAPCTGCDGRLVLCTGGGIAHSLPHCEIFQATLRDVESS